LDAECFIAGDNVLAVVKEQLSQVRLLSVKQAAPRQWMYDLTVEDNHNLVLVNSRICSHNSPDRNYHFRPPAHEETVSQFNRVFGYIWQDEELNEYIQDSLNEIIASPPRTPFANVDSMVSYRREWTTLLLTGGMWFALHALQLNWVADEFSYSVGGVSLDLEKSSKYESAAASTAETFDKQLEKAKACVNVIKGLQQPRYGTGIRSSFGPFSVLGSTQVRVFLPDDSAVDIAIEDLFVTDRPEIRVPLDARQLRVCAVASTGDVGLHIVDKVVQHATFHKSLVRTVLDDGRAVTTTLDHSLFHRVDEAVLPLEAGSLRGGDKIVTVDGGSVAEVTVASVLLLPPVEYTYDLSVPGPESFVLTCGILSHNSGRGVLSPRKFVGL
jgi:hypothetical protein